MDYSDIEDNDDTMKEIQRAQKTLQDVESKMKGFKSRRREKSQQAVGKAPYPDLNKYFSYLTNQLENEEEPQELLIQQDPRSRYHSKEDPLQGYNATRPKFQEKENCSMTINQKLEREKNSSINKIEEYYMQRNQALQEKIKELRLMKEKIVKDQKLLMRNNEELEDELHRQRSNKQESQKLTDLKEKIANMKQKIAGVESDNNKLLHRKKDLEKHVKEVLKTHKEGMAQQMLIRPKSMSSVARCQYH